MPRPATARPPRQRKGCLGGLWLIYKMPFQFLWRAPQLGEAFRRTAATTAGVRAQQSFEQLTPPMDRAACVAVLAEVRSHDAGFDLAATARGVVRARQIVDQARLAGDASAARQVMSDGLWQVFVMVLDSRAAHDIRRQGTSTVVEAKVVAATRDLLAEQLRLRLKCSGERSEAAGGHVLRGNAVPGIWHEDWIIRRSAAATTPGKGGVLSGTCPNCGAVLDVGPDGSCGYCAALVLTSGQDWVVWSIEEEPW
jgi:hypothetical protein